MFFNESPILSLVRTRLYATISFLSLVLTLHISIVASLSLSFCVIFPFYPSSRSFIGKFDLGASYAYKSCSPIMASMFSLPPLRSLYPSHSSALTSFFFLRFSFPLRLPHVVIAYVSRHCHPPCIADSEKNTCTGQLKLGKLGVVCRSGTAGCV